MVGGVGVAAVVLSSQANNTNSMPLRREMPDSVSETIRLGYRSGGLSVYAVVVRYCTMPLEKIAMIMNSSQVSGRGQLSQAFSIAFSDGPLTPFKTVGSASIVAWFFQYSVMGFVVRILPTDSAAHIQPICVHPSSESLPRPSLLLSSKFATGPCQRRSTPRSSLMEPSS